ncbi:hypothetical protein [Dellaglioa algida]|uniref:hypothetical protein n=1 Tax=Dellaglioa algida TaxID=105612 RepID=UPI0024C4D1B2|nr:hypothetical protein [Dellaglioa algida]MDK1727235.1 hypothetical protein [Dellaglioa algida]
MSLGEKTKAMSELPYDARLLLNERHLSESQVSWGTILDVFLESVATFTEFYGFNGDRRALFVNFKKNRREAIQMIRIYKEYRRWFRRYNAHFEKLMNIRFLTLCESVSAKGILV